jgi:NADPH2:quinone reductase
VGGRVIIIGSRGRVAIDPRDTVGRNADIRGLTLLNATPADLKAVQAGLLAGLESGTLKPLIARELPLSEPPQAHETLKHSKIGKIVLLP